MSINGFDVNNIQAQPLLQMVFTGNGVQIIDGKDTMWKRQIT